MREDPKRKGLLFAGTETQVYVSFDDGDHWQSLRLNMAPSSVRDLVVKDDDLVAATHGRGFWILDNITPLRQIGQATAASDAVLFQPATAWRVRWNMNTDTPLPPDEPAAPNPPEGATIDYYLKGPAGGPVTLEILRDGRARGAAVFERRPGHGLARPGHQRAAAAVLVPPAARPLCGAGHAPVRVGRPLPAAAGRRGRRARRVADRGGRLQHGDAAVDAVGGTGRLHGEADRRRARATRSRSS